MRIQKDYPCDRRNFTRGRTGAIEYLVIHYVGALGSARENCVYYGRESVGASAHFYVDHGPGAAVWQSVAEEDTAWHCGTTKGYKHPECRNANSIGIELCCRRDEAGKWYFDSETVDAAVELVRALMGKYGIDADHVVRHYDVTGKICPAPFVGDSGAWTDFKRRLEEKEMTKEAVEALIDQRVKRYEKLGDIPVSYQETVEKLMRVKALVGRSDPDPKRLDDNILDVSDDYCRVMTTLDKLGLLN